MPSTEQQPDIIGGEKSRPETGQNTVWPNFYVVGAQKCGTTSLYQHLKKHPQVFLPEVKEPAYFSDPPPPGAKLLYPDSRVTIDYYQGLYRDARGFEAIGDTSPHYLRDADSARRIHEVCPGAKIIVMLRDPVVRAHSAYLMNLLRDFDSAPTFGQALQRDKERNKGSWFTAWQYVEAGLYSSQVRRYLDKFGKDQVLVLMFEDLAVRSQELFAQVASHLGVDPGLIDVTSVSEPHNYYRMPRFKTAYRIAGALGLRSKLTSPSFRRLLNRSGLLFKTEKPPLDAESRKYLQEIYGPDIAQLEELLGRKLPELRKSWA